jgi:hypothetical protein
MFGTPFSTFCISTTTYQQHINNNISTTTYQQQHINNNKIGQIERTKSSCSVVYSLGSTVPGASDGPPPCSFNARI